MSNEIRIRIDKTVKENEILHERMCNLNCIWCHGDFFNHAINTRAISNKQIVNGITIIGDAIQADSINIKISGQGEPTLVGLSDLESLILDLRRIPIINDIKLVTNGIRLKPMLKMLNDAGLTSVNISINSLNPEKYQRITGHNCLKIALASVHEAVRIGIPIKINAVYSSINDNEINDYIHLSANNDGIPVKFFDLLVTNDSLEKYYLPLEGLKLKLESLSDKIDILDYPYANIIYNIPPNAIISVKIASEINTCPNNECIVRNMCLEGCRSAIRISQDGNVHPCGIRNDNIINLMSKDIEYNIREAILSGGKGWWKDIESKKVESID